MLSKVLLKAARLLVLTHLILFCIFTFKFSNLSLILRNKRKSKGQFHQDLMVLAHLERVKSLEELFFVEFGATNGIDLSNTLLFEREFNAKGIVAEPARVWHDELFLNRVCIISTDCVWSQSNLNLKFFESVNPDLSGLDSKNYFHRPRQSNEVYSVKTVSLCDLLERNNAPKQIDFLSIDTEGSEFDILNSFNFEKYSFRIITCEHNYSKQRKEIQKLLESNGYRRKFSWISFVDDWYFLK